MERVATRNQNGRIWKCAMVSVFSLFLSTPAFCDGIALGTKPYVMDAETVKKCKAMDVAKSEFAGVMDASQTSADPTTECKQAGTNPFANINTNFAVTEQEQYLANQKNIFAQKAIDAKLKTQAPSVIKEADAALPLLFDRFTKKFDKATLEAKNEHRDFWINKYPDPKVLHIEFNDRINAVNKLCVMGQDPKNKISKGTLQSAVLGFLQDPNIGFLLSSVSIQKSLFLDAGSSNLVQNCLKDGYAFGGVGTKIDSQRIKSLKRKINEYKVFTKKHGTSPATERVSKNLDADLAGAERNFSKNLVSLETLKNAKPEVSDKVLETERQFYADKQSVQKLSNKPAEQQAAILDVLSKYYDSHPLVFQQVMSDGAFKTLALSMCRVVGQKADNEVAKANRRKILMGASLVGAAASMVITGGASTALVAVAMAGLDAGQIVSDYQDNSSLSSRLAHSVASGDQKALKDSLDRVLTANKENREVLGSVLMAAFGVGTDAYQVVKIAKAATATKATSTALVKVETGISKLESEATGVHTGQLQLPPHPAQLPAHVDQKGLTVARGELAAPTNGVEIISNPKSGTSTKAAARSLTGKGTPAGLHADKTRQEILDKLEALGIPTKSNGGGATDLSRSLDAYSEAVAKAEKEGRHIDWITENKLLDGIYSDVSPNLWGDVAGVTGKPPLRDGIKNISDEFGKLAKNNFGVSDEVLQSRIDKYKQFHRGATQDEALDAVLKSERGEAFQKIITKYNNEHPQMPLSRVEQKYLGLSDAQKYFLDLSENEQKIWAQARKQMNFNSLPTLQQNQIVESWYKAHKVPTYSKNQIKEATEKLTKKLGKPPSQDALLTELKEMGPSLPKRKALADARDKVSKINAETDAYKTGNKSADHKKWKQDVKTAQKQLSDAEILGEKNLDGYNLETTSGPSGPQFKSQDVLQTEYEALKQAYRKSPWGGGPTVGNFREKSRIARRAGASEQQIVAALDSEFDTFIKRIEKERYPGRTPLADELKHAEDMQSQLDDVIEDVLSNISDPMSIPLAVREKLANKIEKFSKYPPAVSARVSVTDWTKPDSALAKLFPEKQHFAKLVDDKQVKAWNDAKKAMHWDDLSPKAQLEIQHALYSAHTARNRAGNEIAEYQRTVERVFIAEMGEGPANFIMNGNKNFIQQKVIKPLADAHVLEEAPYARHENLFTRLQPRTHVEFPGKTPGTKELVKLSDPIGVEIKNPNEFRAILDDFDDAVGPGGLYFKTDAQSTELLNRFKLMIIDNQEVIKASLNDPKILDQYIKITTLDRISGDKGAVNAMLQVLESSKVPLDGKHMFELRKMATKIDLGGGASIYYSSDKVRHFSWVSNLPVKEMNSYTKALAKAAGDIDESFFVQEMDMLFKNPQALQLSPEGVSDLLSAISNRKVKEGFGSYSKHWESDKTAYLINHKILDTLWKGPVEQLKADKFVGQILSQPHAFDNILSIMKQVDAPDVSSSSWLLLLERSNPPLTIEQATQLEKFVKESPYKGGLEITGTLEDILEKAKAAGR